MVAEEVAEGHVGWPALKLFLAAFGGMWFWTVYMTGFILADVGALGQTYCVWARAYEVNKGHNDYLAVYGIVCGAGVIVFSSAYVIHVLGSVRASRRIHDQLIRSVLGAPLRWLDSTPIGRVIARFTQDIRAHSLPIDPVLTINSPIFTIPGAAIFVLGIWVGQIYIAAQLSVKREMSNARSPLFSHFGAALQGIISIRAYDAQVQFKNEALKRIDKYTRAARTFYNLNRWICIRMDALGGLFAAGLASYLVYYRTSVNASDTGFSLNMAVAFSGGIIWVSH
ncbi:ATP-binding cassette transporter [Rhizoctonia solani AG-1 IA]|uniref:ATP-binding cassette transporter n=1 Tax=Thanatephorus cucumeris (strain AG1-IA) TaxID=983506 RepID=L8X8A0_THACA|nr:ATP-binding cassette transporter [Rhizoctonia solani AG-1 IA]